MAVVEEHKQNSSCPQPKLKRLRSPRNETKDKQMTNTNVNIAKWAKSYRQKPKKCKKAKVERLCDKSEAQSSVLKRATELAANLKREFPSFIKVMLPSHVTRVFWLGIPKLFCREHMPKDDTMFSLEGENGEEYQTKYLVDKDGLSGGWKAFSVAHKLLEGDVVVFHKVMPLKFKVYIVRANGFDEVECPLGLIKFGDGIRPIKMDNTACGSSENGKTEPISVETLQKYVQKENIVAGNTRSGPLSSQCQVYSEVLCSEVLNETRVSESVISFEEVSCIEDFKIMVSGSIINAEISKHHLIKYYELCRSQNSFLHEHILERLNSALVAGIISETVNLSDAISACKITTPECDFLTWDKTLQGSEMLGMNVEFLRSRLNQLASLASKSKVDKEARLAREQAVKDMRTLEAKFSRAKEIINMLNSEIESLDTSSEELEAKFKEVAKAPW